MRRDLISVLALTVVAQGAGFLKSILIARYFGLSADLDGYYLSQVLPAAVIGITMGALQAGFVPEYARLKAMGNDKALAALRGGFLGLVGGIGLIVSVVVSLFAPEIVAVIAAQATGPVQAAATESLRVLAFLLLLNALADYLVTVLQAEFLFVAAAAAPIANALIAAAALWVWPEYGLLTLVWGTIAGWAVQLVIVALILRRAGLLAGATWRMPIGNLSRVLRPALAIAPGVVASNLGLALPSVLVAAAGPGAVSALGYAQRLHGAITQALGTALPNVVLPHFSARLARGEYREIAHNLARLFILLLLLAIVALAGVWLAGEEALTLLFEHGRFDAQATGTVHDVWLWLTGSLFFSTFGTVLAKYLQAAGRAGLLSLLALPGLAILVLVTWASLPLLGPASAAAGILVSQALLAGALWYVVRGELARHGAHRRAMPRSGLVLIFVFAASTGVVAMLKDAIEPVEPLWWVVAIGFAGAVSLLVGYRWIRFSG